MTNCSHPSCDSESCFACIHETILHFLRNLSIAISDPAFCAENRGCGSFGLLFRHAGPDFLAGLNSLLELIDVLNSKDGVTVNFRNTHVEKFVGEEGLKTTRGFFIKDG